jgi:hypothetical protein
MSAFSKRLSSRGAMHPRLAEKSPSKEGAGDLQKKARGMPDASAPAAARVV